MNVRRVVPGVLGVLALGIALGVDDRASQSLPIDAVVALLGNDYLLVAIFAALGLALALPVVLSGRLGALDQADMPEPELPVAAPPPGASFDEKAGRLRTALPLLGRSNRREIRDRLRETAIRTVMRTDGCDRQTATERVDDGAWTADPSAASFLNANASGWGVLVDWIPKALGSRTSFERGAVRAVDAIAAMDSENGSSTTGVDGASTSGTQRPAGRGANVPAGQRAISTNGGSVSEAGEDGTGGSHQLSASRESSVGTETERSVESGRSIEDERAVEGGR